MPSLQFERADFGGDLEDLHRCAFCGRSLSGSPFRFMGRDVCTVCAGTLESALPKDDAATFWRAVGAGGAVAAALALVLLLLVSATSAAMGWIISLAAIGVGWSVGKTMRWASKGAGGLRYQILAVLLTYAAIVIALQIAWMGVERWFVLPLMLLRPVVFLFLGAEARSLGTLMLFVAMIGGRWAWMLLPQGPRLERLAEPPKA